MNTLAKIAVIIGLLFISDVYAYGSGHEYDYYGYHNRHSHYDGEGIGNRQARQHRRIEDGIYYGQLTHKEVKKLHKKQKKIAKLNRRFKRDGYFTNQERYILNHHQDKASERIYEYKHNDRYRKHHHSDYAYYREGKYSAVTHKGRDNYEGIYRNQDYRRGGINGGIYIQW